jgi:hypothetical protein
MAILCPDEGQDRPPDGGRAGMFRQAQKQRSVLQKLLAFTLLPG